MLFAVAFAALIAIACAAASLRRLSFAVAPTAFDPALLVTALRGDDGAKRLPVLERAITKEPSADWERDLFSAIAADDGARAGLVNEALSELDHRVKRWTRVPRVCASIATSSAFLLASLALRAGLSAANDHDEVTSDAINGAVMAAINVAAIGLAGAAVCIAAQMRARRAERAYVEAADQLVARLERLAGKGTFSSPSGQLP
ncbi:hypothetical protein BH09MYX1_BH09MYX1_19880 [soil metagenome]